MVNWGLIANPVGGASSYVSGCFHFFELKLHMLQQARRAFRTGRPASAADAFAEAGRRHLRVASRHPIVRKLRQEHKSVGLIRLGPCDIRNDATQKMEAWP